VEELGKNIDPLVWAQESFRIAQNTTYPFIATTNKLDAAYNTLTYETSKKRITLAGYRLANYILEIYKTAQPIDLEERIKNPMNLWKLLA
jgi:polyphosphate kinase 2 (PPK2 family)